MKRDEFIKYDTFIKGDCISSLFIVETIFKKTYFEEYVKFFQLLTRFNIRSTERSLLIIYTFYINIIFPVL
jgi:hypothetical protein